MLIKDIEELKRRNAIELKKAKFILPNSFLESYSAFANTNGGTIVLGIDEPQKNVFTSAKLTEAVVEEVQTCFWNTINNSKKVKAKRADRFERPVFINDNLYNGTYRRNHQGDYHCTKLKIDLMIKDASHQTNDKTCLD